MSRTINITFDALSGVDGSARFSFDSITALASVSGPIAARLANEHPVRATVEVHVRPLSSVPGTTDKHTGIALKGILERACILSQHPRTLIQVVVQALSPSSSRSAGVWRASSSRTRDVDINADVLLAAEINACSLALLNAGSVQMRGVVCAVAVLQPIAGHPELITEGDDGSKLEYTCTGCFTFLFGVDGTRVEGADHIPPAEMIWTNYRASPGNAFAVTALIEAEKVALDGAKEVWMKMKESLKATSFAGDGMS